MLGERGRYGGNQDAVHASRHTQAVATRLVVSGAQ